MDNSRKRITIFDSYIRQFITIKSFNLNFSVKLISQFPAKLRESNHFSIVIQPTSNSVKISPVKIMYENFTSIYKRGLSERRCQIFPLSTKLSEKKQIITCKIFKPAIPKQLFDFREILIDLGSLTSERLVQVSMMLLK